CPERWSWPSSSPLLARRDARAWRPRNAAPIHDILPAPNWYHAGEMSARSLGRGRGPRGPPCGHVQAGEVARQRQRPQAGHDHGTEVVPVVDEAGPVEAGAENGERRQHRRSGVEPAPHRRGPGDAGERGNDKRKAKRAWSASHGGPWGITQAVADAAPVKKL